MSLNAHPSSPRYQACLARSHDLSGLGRAGQGWSTNMEAMPLVDPRALGGLYGIVKTSPCGELTPWVLRGDCS